ncbi:MAG: prolipoprotein diacylglyceryl transferase, partial [Elusimicrobia bacterium]|nr:prolipoprotein diacylglyceryl transferase [Elusimicrobiota bacterium]
MYPVLSLEAFHTRTYGVILVVAFLCAQYIFKRRMVGLRFSPGTAEGAFWFWVPGGLIGAWLLNILAKTIETLNIFSLGTGGLTF